jgi:hypothetical protein
MTRTSAFDLFGVLLHFYYGVALTMPQGKPALRQP